MKQGLHSRPAGSASIPVWDRFVRTMHWAIVIATPLAWFSHGGLLDIHRAAGYTLLGLALGRIAWGFTGNGYARFANFVPGPGRFASYMLAMARGRETRYIGHNPAGGMMIVVLLAVMLALGASGWMLDSPAYRDHPTLHGIHAILSDGLIVLVALHVAGVLYASWRHRENLILAMTTGRKAGDGK